MIVNLTRQTTIASKVAIANTPSQRMKGLLGLSHFPPGEALVITQCQSIHMMFMKISLDVIFCDKQHKVVGLCKGIKPFRLSPLFFKSSYAIELPTGTITSSQTQLGDLLDVPTQ